MPFDDDMEHTSPRSKAADRKAVQNLERMKKGRAAGGKKPKARGKKKR